MFGYQAAKIVENVARNAGMSDDTARAAGVVTAYGSAIIAQDASGLAYVAEHQIREHIRERSERSGSNRQRD